MNDDDRKILFNWLTDKPMVNDQAIDPILITQEDRFRFVSNIFISRTVS